MMLVIRPIPLIEKGILLLPAALIFGARQSLRIGVFSVAIGAILGTILGSIAGFYGGKVDNIIMRFLDIYQSIPGMLLSIALAASLGPGVNNAILAVGISTIPVYSRIIRASIMTVRDKEYIEAATAINASDFRIITKHVLPNSFADRKSTRLNSSH